MALLDRGLDSFNRRNPRSIVAAGRRDQIARPVKAIIRLRLPARGNRSCRCHLGVEPDEWTQTKAVDPRLNIVSDAGLILSPDRHRPKRPVLTSNLDVLPSREILPDAPDAALSFEQQRAQTGRFGIFEAQDPANAATDNQQVKPLTLLHNYPADCTPRRG